MSNASDKIIVALDVPTLHEATRLSDKIVGSVGGFKVGLELLTRCAGTGWR